MMFGYPTEYNINVAQTKFITFITFNSKKEMIGIGDMYRTSMRVNPCGIEGYQITKKYVNTHPENTEQVKKIEPKRGHYLQDHAKIYGANPGPGVYNHDKDMWTKQTKSTGKMKNKLKKMTYFEEIMEKQKKEKRPGPGQYKLFKDDKDLKEQKNKLKHKKVSVIDRYTYLDAVQYEASTTPGVGSYNAPNLRPRSATTHKSRPLSSRPGTATKKIKQPDMGTYNPKEAPRYQSFNKKSKGYHEWGHVDRFKNQKVSNLGPGCYSGAQDNKGVGKKHSKSVYYH